jgi:hypothetical protein
VKKSAHVDAACDRRLNEFEAACEILGAQRIVVGADAVLRDAAGEAGKRLGAAESRIPFISFSEAFARQGALSGMR